MARREEAARELRSRWLQRSPPRLRLAGDSGQQAEAAVAVPSQKSSSQSELVKENKPAQAPLSGWWVLAALAASAATLAVVASIDYALPEPLGLDAPPQRFRALTAHQHLVNLTSIGPRVAGSYENEVLAVSILVSAIKHIAAHASPHNRVELDVHTASGAFALSFMDGMNNVYRGVQSVVARVRGAGGRARARSALLLNCHFDTVPDSPGASDDGAGCAVLLDTLRALAAGGALRHDAVFLFNGAEENILQASHAFITQHKWAKDVRAFINIEACGAGGREVLFQAGPHDPWIIEMYAGAVPHPFASSLAQELFESGLIPADTDFRIFRDFGKLSGVDLAWSSNGYVYHTRLDTPDCVPPDVLQRTGDNVLALAHGLLASESLESEPDATSRQPVFFDVLGLAVVAVRAPAALLLAAGTLALALLKVHASAGAAQRALWLPRQAWWRAVARAAAASAAAHALGVLAAVAPALLLHQCGARLSFYSRGALLAPLYALPALAGTWAAAARLWGAPSLLRGWWGARAWHDAGTLAWAALLLLCMLRGLRSGFLPLLWALLAACADLLAGRLGAQGASGGTRAALWALGAALPAAQTWYLSLGSLHMFVPIMGRAGSGAVPPDVTMAVLVALLVQASCGWLLPLVLAARGMGRVVRAAGVLCAATVLLVLLSPLGAPYSSTRPQRLMVFHTRRTLHAPLVPTDRVDNFYWVPELDANTPHSVDKYVPEMRLARPLSDAECARLLYCGAPYYLPVLSLIARSHAAPAPSAPLPRLAAQLALRRLNATALELSVRLSGPPHAVLLVAPAPGARVAWSSALARPREGAAWGARRTYFVALHDARGAGGAAWRVSLLLTHAAGLAPPHWADVSLGGHALFGAQAQAPEHEALLRALPDWVAGTGWGVDLHLYRV